MPYPNIPALLQPLGQDGGFDLVWNFIGSRPAYSIFTGLCELTGALLVLSRRTRVFGSLFMATVLTNVVCFNFFYNVPVKILCSTLLLADLFLVAPYLSPLIRFFYRHQPVSLAEKPLRFAAQWKNYLLIALMIFPAWVTLRITYTTWQRYQMILIDRKNERLYDVRLFIRDKDTVPPLLTDSSRWKRLALTSYRGTHYGVVYNMKDIPNWLSPKNDTVHRLLTLTDYPDTTRKMMFHYARMPHGGLALQGLIKGRQVQMLLDSVSTDTLLLNKEKIKWVQEY